MRQGPVSMCVNSSGELSEDLPHGYTKAQETMEVMIGAIVQGKNPKSQTERADASRRRSK